MWREREFWTPRLRVGVGGGVLVVSLFAGSDGSAFLSICMHRLATTIFNDRFFLFSEDCS
jgi:hypothetical protein